MFARKFSRRALLIGAVGLVLMIGLGTMLMVRKGEGPVVRPVPFSDLLRQLDRGAVAEVIVSGDALEYKLTNGEQ